MKKQAKYHTWTTSEDITMVYSIVNGSNMKSVAQALKVTVAQAQNRLQTLKLKGLKVERLNNNKEVVTVGLLNPENFDSAFIKAVDRLTIKCLERENDFIKKGYAKFGYKATTLAEDNTMKFFGRTKTDEQYSKLFGRPLSAIKNRRKELNI